MDEELWMSRYMVELQDRAGITLGEARDIYEAGIEDHDFDEDPEDAARDELSYWD